MATTIQNRWASRIGADIRTAIAFCTRLPAGRAVLTGSDVARASWALPVAGAVVGGIAALVYVIAGHLRLPPALAAALALAAATAVTGALHEDGLADTADGFGGGKDRESKLAIMRDSRLGTYGACALIISFLLRWSALASIADPAAVSIALVAVHASARAPLPLFMRLVAPARAEGLAAAAGEPARASAAVACGLGALALFLALGPAAGATAVASLITSGALLSALSRRQIGGQTGDVIGALEQVNEALVMLIAVVALNG